MDEQMAPARVTFLGLGGGGSKIAAGLTVTDAGTEMDIVVADADAPALERLTGVEQIQLGSEWTNGQGCAGDTSLGEKAAAATKNKLYDVVSRSDSLFVSAGLGGGTGGGTLRVVSQLAQEAGTPTTFLLTLPFSFEGNWRRRIAGDSLAPLRQSQNALIVVPNDLLFTTLNADTPAREAFCHADAILAEGLASLATMTIADGLIPADLATFRRVLQEQPATNILAVGRGTGEDRASKAIQSLFNSPLLGNMEQLQSADAAVVSVLGSADVSVGEVQQCLQSVQEYLPDDTQMVVGASTSDHIQELQITLLLSHHERQHKKEPQPEDNEPAPDNSPSSPPPAEKKSTEKPPPPRQGTLPLQEQNAGIFSATAPTLVNGENLDIPTFQRKGIIINTEIDA